MRFKQQSKWLSLLPVILYVSFLCYGTLYPWQGWRIPSETQQQLDFERGWKLSYTDIFANVSMYIPLGFLLANATVSRSSVIKLLIALLGGVLLSTFLEFLQIFLPARVPSLWDIISNVAGAFIGGGICISFFPQEGIYIWLLSIRQAYIQSGALANISLFLLGLWAISQTMPWIPSLDISNLRQGLKPLWYVLTQRSSLEVGQTIVYSLETTALGLIIALTFKPDKPVFWWFLGFVSAVFILQVSIINHVLTAEAIVGTGIGMLCFAMLYKQPRKIIIVGGIAALFGAITINRLDPITNVAPANFNSILFQGYLNRDLMNTINVLLGSWPFLALSLLVLRFQQPGRVFIWGGIGIAVGMIALEWKQQYRVNQYLDIINTVSSLFMWWFPWMYRPLRQEIYAAYCDN
ncbi:VanZ family protein [Candidatus Nitrosoglobus terrae]|uniref:VanZ family protein n=1 Tax=Candidatus Nitrosoglobus terrae TaxID=1630141 RepID=UPI000BBAC47D|nr:VanZ family protein [Candidatus Nitrosoglobus terrae]